MEGTGGEPVEAASGESAEATPGPLPACGTDTALAVASCVDRARFEKDLRFIAQPRVPGSEHWQAVQDLCADRLGDLGFTVERQAYGTGVNVIGRRGKATAEVPPVLLGAHYDHIANCPGADDNATGVAGVLELARVLTEVQPDRPLMVACWDEEERGLVGSRAFVEAGYADVLAGGTHLNVEMIGYRSLEPNTQKIPDGLEFLSPGGVARVRANEYRADFLAAVSDQGSAEAMAWFEAYAARVGLPVVAMVLPELVKDQRIAADLHRSDHASFWDRELPGLMVADSADLRYPAYHCAKGKDVVENLDLEFSTLSLRALAATAARSLGLDGDDGVTRP